MTDPKGLAILICSPGVDRPELCVTPLVHAIVARAMRILRATVDAEGL